MFLSKVQLCVACQPGPLAVIEPEPGASPREEGIYPARWYEEVSPLGGSATGRGTVADEGLAGGEFGTRVEVEG